MQVYQELKTSRGTLRGFLHQPDTIEKHPLVIMYHGFTGHKCENHFLFAQCARFLCEHNIACLRFDFLGSGDSDGEFSEMTFSKEVEEALIILDYAKTLPDVSEIIVLGLSMGGAVATQVSKARPEEIKKLVLWAPAGHMSQVVKTQREHFPQLDNGNIMLGGLEVSLDFALDLENKDMYEGVEVFKNPVLIQHDKNDQAVPLAISKKYKAVYPNSTLIVYEQSDHTFTNVSVRRKLFADLLAFIQS